MTELTNIEIRIKACEISFRLCGAISSAMIVNAGVKNLNEIAPFGLVNDIEKYIRTGEIPVPIRMEIKKVHYSTE